MVKKKTILSRCQHTRHLCSCELSCVTHESVVLHVLKYSDFVLLLVQARFMRDRERIRKAGLEHSNAHIVQQDMQLGVDRKSKVDYGAGGYTPKK